MTDATRRGTEIDAQLDHASPLALWLDTPARPAPRPPLDGDVETDLVVIGGGFTGLWTALRAKERDPDRRVLLLEADRLAEHATGRNGGFCEASLTHGEANGRDRWPDEYALLDRLGRENLAGIAATVEGYGIDCDFRIDGVLTVATREHEVAGLSPDEPGFLGADVVRELVDSPTYIAGRWTPTAAPWWTPPASPGGWPTPPSRSASGSRSGPESRTCRPGAAGDGADDVGRGHR